MKSKKLLILGTAAALVLGGIAGIASNRKAKAVYADEEVVYTLDGTVTASGNAYATASTVTQNDIGWKVEGNTEQSPWRIGGKSITNQDRLIYSTTALSDNISKIEVESGATASSLTVNSLTITIHENAADALTGSNAVATKSVTTGIVSSTVTFEKADSSSWANKYYRIVYNVTRTSSSGNGYITFNNAKFYSLVSEPAFTIDKSAAELVIGGPSIDITAEPNQYVNNNATYLWHRTSGDDCVILTNANTPTVTITPKGEAAVATCVLTIDVTDCVSKTVSVTVKKPRTVAEAIDIINNGSAEDKIGVYVTGIVSAVVEISTEHGNGTYNISSNGLTTGDQLQAFRGKYLDGASFTDEGQVKVGATVIVYGNLKKYNSTYELDQGNKLISYSYPENKLDDPEPHYSYSDNEITWANVEHASSYNLKVDNDPVIENATSPYELGSFETPSGHTVTVTAIGDKVTYLDSNPGVVKFAFLDKDGTREEPYDIANAKAAIDGNTGVTGVYVAGIISQIGTYNSQYNSLTYWISDDGETTSDQFEVYSGKGLNNTNFSSENDVEVGAAVVVYGNIKFYDGTYEFDKNNYLVEYPTPVVTEYTVTFNTDGGSTVDPKLVAEGNYAQQPADPTKDGYTFGGWYTDVGCTDGNEFDFENTPITADLPLYAKWDVEVIPPSAIEETGLFVKVTNANQLIDGEKYLIASDNNCVVFDGSLETLDAVGNKVDFSNDDVDVDVLKPAFFYIGLNGENTYYIKSASNYYIGLTGNSNGLKTSADDDYENAITFSSGNVVITSSGRTLQYNKTSGQTRFRYFGSAQESIQLYRFLKPSECSINSTSSMTIHGVESGEGQSLTVSSVAVRFGAVISGNDWDILNSKWEIEDYGLMLVKKTTLNSYHQAHNEINTIEDVYNSEHYDNKDDVLFIRSKKSYNNNVYATPQYDSDSGNYYFSLKINMTQASYYGITYCAVPFIVADGEYVFLQQMECSVNSLAEQYYNEQTYPYLSMDALEWLMTAH